MKFKGTVISNPHHPRNMITGGKVRRGPRMSRRQLTNDSVATMLQPGEAVIPVKYYHKASKRPINLADRVLNELKKQGIDLPAKRRRH